MIEQFLKKEKAAIDKELEDYFNYLDENEHEILLKDFIKQLKEFMCNKNAKRLHPILLIAAFNGIVNPIYLNEQIDSIRRVSLAMEFLHSGQLIHDDLIDNEKERRSKPTFHIQLKKELEAIYKNHDFSHKSEHISMYGRDISILGGSHAYFLGLNVIKNSKFPENLKLLAITEYSDAVDYLIKGHIVEEYMRYHGITMSLEQYLDVAEMQKARLLEKSVKIGSILAKGNLHYQIHPLSKAMLKIGQAYAIRDDILDMRDDIKRKIKKNFVYILAIQNSNEEQSKILNGIYQLDKLSKDEITQVERIFAETNSVITAEHFSKNLVAQAKTLLKDIYPDLNKEQKFFFNEFSDYIYMREF